MRTRSPVRTPRLRSFFTETAVSTTLAATSRSRSTTRSPHDLVVNRSPISNFVSRTVRLQGSHAPNDPVSDDRDVSSAHETVSHFLMGDGRIKGISVNINFAVYQALSTRAGRESIADE